MTKCACKDMIRDIFESGFYRGISYMLEADSDWMGVNMPREVKEAKLRDVAETLSRDFYKVAVVRVGKYKDAHFDKI